MSWQLNACIFNETKKVSQTPGHTVTVTCNTHKLTADEWLADCERAPTADLLIWLDPFGQHFDPLRQA
jgi:hypothetical protein